MHRYFMILILCSLWLPTVFGSSHSFIGVHKALKDTQNSSGKLEDKPFSPTIGYGYNFDLFGTGFGFSPQIGYIHTKQVADDSYGKQKVHTIFFNWDFMYIPTWTQSLAFRFGIGNFIKRTSGEGGKVTIPNGSGTAKANRPSKTVSSYSSTFDFGADYKLNLGLTDWWVEDLGFRFELYVFRPLSKEYRNYAFNLGTILYF